MRQWRPINASVISARASWYLTRSGTRRNCLYASREWGVRNGEWGVGNMSFRIPHSPFPTPHSPFPSPHTSLHSQPGYSRHRVREFNALHRVVGAEDSAVGGHQPAIKRTLDVAARA